MRWLGRLWWRGVGRWLVETQVLRYERSSSLGADSRRLDLRTSGGVGLREQVEHPRFFDGFVSHPLVAAEGIRQVAAVAAAAYVRRERPPGGGLDPVVTADGRGLRFESQSLCGGVHARLDLLEGGLEGDCLDRGTTNVDVNEPLRRMLGGVPPNGLLHLAVGSGELVATTADGGVVEKRVPLSTRWLRGFAEAQHIAATFDLLAELPALEASRFLSGVRSQAQGWVLPSQRSWRLSSRAVPGAFFLSGSDRLATMMPLLRHATRLRVYGSRVSEGVEQTPSAWELDLPHARFVLLLSPGPARGFSGEGAVLTDLSSGCAVDDAEEVHTVLRFQERLDPSPLADQLGLTVARVNAALACLAVSGRVGYDLAEAAYFHRELPYDAAAVRALNPRLRNAEQLVGDGAVSILNEAVAEVLSGDNVHRVRRRDDGSMSCTCRWGTTHGGDRGPCKHVLAVLSVRSGDEDGR